MICQVCGVEAHLCTLLAAPPAAKRPWTIAGWLRRAA
jgi:hypothetical protein